MTSLSCRRVDNAPRHCRFLRTFDFAGDCRVNFSGVCCIVAREYEGRRFAATREGCLGYSSFSSFSPSPVSLPLSSRGPPVRRDARSLAGPSNLPWEDFKLQSLETASPSWTAQPPVASSRKHARGNPHCTASFSSVFFFFSFFLFHFAISLAISFTRFRRLRNSEETWLVRSYGNHCPKKHLNILNGKDVAFNYCYLCFFSFAMLS